jgi:hypothetical protein
MVEALYKLLATNPNRFASVDPIDLKVHSDTQDKEDRPATICGWVPMPLEPPGPVSAALWKTNPEFRAATPPVRRTILREAIITLQQRVENELRGRKWQRKKIMEQLSAQQSADASPPQDTRELDAALAHFYQVQLVIVDEANKKIRWVPEDPRTWSASQPVWGLSLGSRAIFHRSNESNVGTALSQWLSDREVAGWRIEFPLAEGTLESMKQTMNEMNLGMGSRIEKPKKADYEIVLGRALTIRHLQTHFSGQISDTLEPMN